MLLWSLREYKAMTAELGSLLTAIEADLQATLNVEAHAGMGWASEAEVRDSLGRIIQLRDYWRCGNCATSVWAISQPPLAQCKCGRTRFPVP